MTNYDNDIPKQVVEDVVTLPLANVDPLTAVLGVVPTGQNILNEIMKTVNVSKNGIKCSISVTMNFAAQLLIENYFLTLTKKKYILQILYLYYYFFDAVKNT